MKAKNLIVIFLLILGTLHVSAQDSIIGLMPIALATGAASEWKNGIAWVLIGGLTSSMLLTLVIVPVVYSLMEKAKIKVQGWVLKLKHT